MRIPAGLLPHQIQVTPYLGDTAYGPLYGDLITYRARVQFTTGITKDKDGNDTVYSARIFMEPEAMIAPEALITYIDTMGRSYSLIAITVAPQFDVYGQPAHVEIEAKYG